MCLLDVREGGSADGGVGAEEKGASGGVNRRSLGEVWWKNNLPVFVSVCVDGEVRFVYDVYLGFVFFVIPVPSCEKRK